MTRLNIFAMMAACTLAACQTTTTPATTSGTVAPVAADTTQAINAALDACLGYVETGAFTAAPVIRAGFSAGRAVTGTNYRLPIGTSTLDRVNARSITVTPRRAPGCSIALNGVGGTFTDTTNAINQRIIAGGWRYDPQGRTRSYTKGALRMDMVASSFNGLKTFGLTRN